MSGWPPKKNTAFTWTFFIRDADGDPVAGAAALDVQFSVDEGTFGAVAGTEVDEGEGMYSCPISATEMNGDRIGLICKTSTAGAKTAAQVIYTARLQLDDLDPVDINTAASAPTATTLPFASGKTANVGAVVRIISAATGAGQSRFVEAFAAGIATVDTWDVTPTGTVVYAHFPVPPGSSTGVTVGIMNEDVVDFLAVADSGANKIADAVHDEPIEDHDTEGTAGWGVALSVYGGPDGPGIYIDSGAANTNTVVGTDGTEKRPVSTFVAGRTLADALGLKIYYLEGNSDITLAATHEDWEFIGIGSVADNVVNLGSQDVDRSLFRNLTLEGTQGGTGRITARDCALQDPGPGTTTFHIFAERCGIVDDILVDTSADNVFDQCYSLAASGTAPIITATGAAGSIIISHWGGKIELKSLSASHNIELDGNGHITFNADCNVNANLDIHGVWDVTDNTAGMADLVSMAGLVNTNEIRDAILAAIIESTITLKQSIALQNAASAGKLSGGGSGTNLLRDLADTLDRITASVDLQGNRTAITTDFTDL